MKALLVALTMFPFSLHAAEQAPSLSVEPDETTTQIIGAPFMHKHGGKLFLCGIARKYNSTRKPGRFVFSLEADWRIYEPEKDSNEIWESWNETYLEICETE